MSTVTGRLATASASRYLQQLCKHFGHKVEASWDETTGWVALHTAEARLAATDKDLTIVLIGEGSALGQARGVIDSHLQRFAFREEVTGLDWGAVEEDGTADQPSAPLGGPVSEDAAGLPSREPAAQP